MRDFLNPKDFYNALCMHGMDYFCGVPDSLLKDFCAYVTAVTPKSRHVITSNEGQAVALAAGYHMATGKAGVVYLQVVVISYFFLALCFLIDTYGHKITQEYSILLFKVHVELGLQ